MWKWKYNTGFNWLFAETGMVLQDNLEQVVRVDEINLVPRLSKFFLFKRNLLPLPQAHRSFKAFKNTLPHILWPKITFLSEWPQLGHRLPAQPEIWLCPGWSPGTDHCGLFLQFLHPKYSQLVTPPVLISFYWVSFIEFSLFLVIKVKCKVLNALVRDSLTAVL